MQPSTFCVYKFFDLPDQDTVIVPASNNPEYSDHRTFSIFTNSDVEKYLKTEDLFVYIFDDNELDIGSHIGRAAIPLQSLLQNKPIKGIFELEKNGRQGYGSIEVLIYWQFEYMAISTPTSAVCDVDKPKKPVVSSLPSCTPPSSDDETVNHPPSFDVSFMQPPVPKPRKSIPSGPVTSTPISKNSLSSSSDEERNSPKISPNHAKRSNFTVAQEAAKQSSRSSGAGKEIKVAAEVHSPADGPSPQNKPQVSQTKAESDSTDTSDEDKHAFSDESEESENEIDPADKQIFCSNQMIQKDGICLLR